MHPHLHVERLQIHDYSYAAPPLTVNNILMYIKSLSGMWDQLGLDIGIPSSELDAIEASGCSDEEALTSVVEAWLQEKGDPVRWREFTWPLYEYGDNAAAEKVKTFAEPPAGEGGM